MISLILIGVALGLSIQATRMWRADRNKALKVSAGALILGLMGVFFLPGGYLIQKIIGRLMMPMGLLWSALFFAAIWAIIDRKKPLAIVTTLTWLTITFAGSPFIGGWLISSLEAPYTDINVYDEAPFEAILVLGGGVTGGDGYAQLSESGDRPIVAARMYRRGLSKLLVTSGSSIPGINTQTDVAATTSIIWHDLGIPDSDIIRVPEPKNTSEEIRAFSKLAEERGWKRIGLITSAFHMRRAMKLADANQIQLVALPSDFTGGRTYEGLSSWIPDRVGFNKTQKACWEYLGALVGR